MDILGTNPKIAPQIIENIGDYILGIAIGIARHSGCIIELGAAVGGCSKQFRCKIILKASSPPGHARSLELAGGTIGNKIVAKAVEIVDIRCYAFAIGIMTEEVEIRCKECDSTELDTIAGSKMVGTAFQITITQLTENTGKADMRAAFIPGILYICRNIEENAAKSRWHAFLRYMSHRGLQSKQRTRNRSMRARYTV